MFCFISVISCNSRYLSDTVLKYITHFTTFFISEVFHKIQFLKQLSKMRPSEQLVPENDTWITREWDMVVTNTIRIVGIEYNGSHNGLYLSLSYYVG